MIHAEVVLQPSQHSEQREGGKGEEARNRYEELPELIALLEARLHPAPPPHAPPPPVVAVVVGSPKGGRQRFGRRLGRHPLEQQDNDVLLARQRVLLAMMANNDDDDGDWDDLEDEDEGWEQMRRGVLPELDGDARCSAAGSRGPDGSLQLDMAGCKISPPSPVQYNPPAQPVFPVPNAGAGPGLSPNKGSHSRGNERDPRSSSYRQCFEAELEAARPSSIQRTESGFGSLLESVSARSVAGTRWWREGGDGAGQGRRNDEASGKVRDSAPCTTRRNRNNNPPTQGQCPPSSRQPPAPCPPPQPPQPPNAQPQPPRKPSLKGTRFRMVPRQRVRRKGSAGTAQVGERRAEQQAIAARGTVPTPRPGCDSDRARRQRAHSLVLLPKRPSPRGLECAVRREASEVKERPQQQQQQQQQPARDDNIARR